MSAVLELVDVYKNFGATEIIRGVNPWRRLLGTAVVAWQLIALVV